MEKWNPNKPLSAIYLDGDKKQYYIKRFLAEGGDKKTLFITEHENSVLETLSSDWMPQFQINFSKVKGKEKSPELINVDEFISVKGIKALGNKLTNHKVKSFDILDSIPYEETKESELSKANENAVEETENLSIEIQSIDSRKAVKVLNNEAPKKAIKQTKPIEPITPIADSPSEEVEFEIDITNLEKPADNSKKKREPITPSDDEDDGQLGLF